MTQQQQRQLQQQQEEGSDEQQQSQQQQQQQQPRDFIVLPPSRALADMSDLESNEDPDAAVAHDNDDIDNNERRTQPVHTNATIINPRDVLQLSRMPSTQEGLEAELDGEEAILTDAVNEMVMSTVTTAVTNAYSFLTQPWFERTAWSGMGLSAISLGLGLLGRQQQVRSSQSWARSYYPSDRTLFSGAAVSALGVGTLWGIRRMFRSWKDVLEERRRREEQGSGEMERGEEEKKYK